MVKNKEISLHHLFQSPAQSESTSSAITRRARSIYSVKVTSRRQPWWISGPRWRRTNLIQHYRQSCSSASSTRPCMASQPTRRSWMRLEKLKKVLEVYEAHLSENTYLAGEFVSFANISEHVHLIQ